MSAPLGQQATLPLRSQRQAHQMRTEVFIELSVGHPAGPVNFERAESRRPRNSP